MDFKNKVVIVTGSSSGIGEATAKLFASHSAKLVIVGRNEENLKRVAAEVEIIRNIKPLLIKADVIKDEDVKRIIDETIKEFGQIDVLVNNAGAGANVGLRDGIEHFDHMISTNLRSVYLLTSLAVPYLAKTKGTVVNVSSIVAIKPFPTFLPYSVAKAGLDMFTKCIAKELATEGIRVNSVNPGPVASDFHYRLGLDKEALDELSKHRVEASPLMKVATSEDVGEVIIFLASEKAKSITGSIYVIDNGYVL